VTEICVIDDDRDMQRALRDHLELDGFKVREASNAYDAVRLIEYHDSEIAIVDLAMTAKEGLSTVLEIKKRFKQNVRVLAIVDIDAQALGLAHALGADDAVPKPVHPATLLACVRKMMRGSSSPGAEI
jgi:DNA-binding response OmpR family regulator